jgi:hypothetical protein
MKFGKDLPCVSRPYPEFRQGRPLRVKVSVFPFPKQTGIRARNGVDTLQPVLIIQVVFLDGSLKRRSLAYKVLRASGGRWMAEDGTHRVVVNS